LPDDDYAKKSNNRKDFVNKRGFFFRFLDDPDLLTIAGIIIPLVTLVAVGYILYQTILSFVSHIENLESTLLLSPMLERTMLYLVEAETGQRGYLLTGNINYLKPYDNTLKNIDNQVQSLLNLASNNQSQQMVIREKVIPLIDKQLGILEQSINLNDEGLNTSRAFNSTTLIDESKANLDNIRIVIQNLQDEQNSFLKNRSELLEHESNFTLYKILFLILAIFIITAMTIFTINRKIKRRNLDIKRKLEYEIKQNTAEIKKSNIKLEKLNEQLKLNDKLQREFINIAAHELRTPTQAITGYSEMALENENYKSIDSRYGQFITAIGRNASRLQDLIEKILYVAKIESNSLQLDRDNVDIVEEIKNILREYESRIENIKNNIDIKFDDRNDVGKYLVEEQNTVITNLIAPTQPIIVKIDKTRIYQVITNLLNNAIKATLDNHENVKGNPLITISIEIRNCYDTNTEDGTNIEDKLIPYKNSNQFVFVSITDSGNGIPEELTPNLFSKFASFTEKGIGLGLYISKVIIEMHGGKIRAYNSHIDGKGATIEFTIPYNPGVTFEKKN
jgi:signal transduction histidine kinase